MSLFLLAFPTCYQKKQGEEARGLSSPAHLLKTDCMTPDLASTAWLLQTPPRSSPCPARLGFEGMQMFDERVMLTRSWRSNNTRGSLKPLLLGPPGLHS